MLLGMAKAARIKISFKLNTSFLAHKGSKIAGKVSLVGDYLWFRAHTKKPSFKVNEGFEPNFV